MTIEEIIEELSKYPRQMKRNEFAASKRQRKHARRSKDCVH